MTLGDDEVGDIISSSIKGKILIVAGHIFNGYSEGTLAFKATYKTI